MTEGVQGWFQRLWASLRDRKARWLLWLGLAGMVVIALSEWVPSGAGQTDSPASVAVSASAVEQALEARIAALVSRVAGVGDCRVMVTLESGSRYVYASEQSYSGPANNRGGSEKTITVQTDTGPVGLLVTEIQPTVKGVAVVCAGGGNEAVREQVRSLICAALNISSGRVFVAEQQ